MASGPQQQGPNPATTGAPAIRRPRHAVLIASTLAIAAIVLVPVATLVTLALSGDGADWPHLAANVLPGAAATTAALLLMVGGGTAVTGVAAAWLVAGFDFPFRRTLTWALVLPLAVPPYLAAYALAEFFHFTGPAQTALRVLLGATRPADYWFPEIRSTPGAAFVLTSVLYPYVYLTARIVFVMQGRNIADVARTLGASPGKVFARVLLPVARPAIVTGVALALMETVNDIGASEFLGVRTLTFSVFSTWLNRGSLEGAAQIATSMLLMVIALISLETWGRRRLRFHDGRATEIVSKTQRVTLSRGKGLAAALLVAAPVGLGFGIPLLVFGRYAAARLNDSLNDELVDALVTSIATAGITAVATVAIALCLLNAMRLTRSRHVGQLVRAASAGYALPGTILGLGLLFALARLDNAIDGLARQLFGLSTGLVLTGSAFAVVLACTIRFLALAEGAIRSGWEKLPPHLDDAARSLGQPPAGSAAKVLLPLLRPAIMTAAVFVFVDTVKELSATILLRPFGFGTLATLVYENASRGVVEDGAVAALLIIATSLVPVILLSRELLSRETAGATLPERNKKKRPGGRLKML